ncbi:hypothetical protein SteCoe_18523 [Stentor coeruleus]|uniref:Uncharacterized protein n=1 Tax=Stentor coeruleus TaxID=5963 RepID=A0A1R2BW99_9CILI|nr:hypothetical protein SteCoe_18523 [Stentor coeruleus]
MSGIKALKNFKKDLINKIPIAEELPILASIGKQSKGKSYFLRYFLNDQNVPSKDHQKIHKGTINLFSKSYESLGFTLFDMEGLESEENELDDRKRDSFNFCSVFAISDIVMLNISHDDLENQIFINNFSYDYWRYCMSAIKLRQRKLFIILCIRDPRWTDESLEIIDAYKQLVNDFTKSINLKLNDLTKLFVEVGKPFLDKECDNPEDINAGDIVCNEYANYMKNLNFTIDEYYVIFFKKSYDKKIVKYLELVRVNNQEAMFKKNSRFENMMRFIIQKSNEIRNEQNINLDSDFSEFRKIRDFIEAEKKENMSKKNIVEEIYLHAIYDPIMYSPNFEGLLKFMESYYKIYQIIKEINEEIIRSVDRETVTDLNFLEFRSANEKIIENAIKNEKFDEKIINKLKAYIKFISAKSYIEVLKLNKSNPERISYQSLMFAIKYSNHEEIIYHQLKEISKRKLIFKCSPFNDIDFQEIIYTLFNKKNFVFESIYEIYQEEVAKKSCEFDYAYFEVLNTELACFEDQIRFINIFKVFDSSKINYNQVKIREFLSILMKVHKKNLTEKKIKLHRFNKSTQSMNAIFERNVVFGFIPATYMSEKVYPSLCGLFISFLNEDYKKNLLEALNLLAAARNSVLGWTIFGKTTITSFLWSLSSFFSKTSTEYVGLKKLALEGYKICSLISNCDIINGKIIDSQNNADKNLKWHELFYKVEHHKADSFTLCIKATFYSIHIR